MVQEYDQIAAIQNELMSKLSQLETDYENQSDYLNKLKEEQVDLETLVRKLHFSSIFLISPPFRALDLC